MVENVNRSRTGPKTYGQFCALARSLDVVGERWTLLIVRDLLPGPMRYSELKASLAGIATNLLAARLRNLEAGGIVERRLQDGGVVYALTTWGAGLRAPMEALGRWGSPLLATGRGDDAFQPRWLTLALPALLRGATASPAVELGIETDGFSMVLRVDADGPSASVRPDDMPETLFIAPPEVVVGLAAGAITIEQAVGEGQLRGDTGVLRAVLTPGPISDVRSTTSSEAPRNTTRSGPARVYVDMVGDLFHAGHVELLRAARAHGDRLVVGVLSDETAASYKRRPITSLAERVAVIGACRYVDEVIADAPFRVDEDFLVEHDISVVVHGDDLTPQGAEEVYGAAVDAGILEHVPRTPGISTTDLIRRVLERER